MSDLISKAALFNRLASANDKAEIFSIIQEMPTVEDPLPYYKECDSCKHGSNYAEPNKGNWTENSAGRLICNQCGHYAASILSNFCPFCGADMRGEEE